MVADDIMRQSQRIRFVVMSALTSIGWQLIQLLALNALMVFTVMAQPGPDYQWLDQPARFAPEEGVALWHQYPDEERLRLYFPAHNLRLFIDEFATFQKHYPGSYKELFQVQDTSWIFLLDLLGQKTHPGKTLFEVVSTFNSMAIKSAIKERHYASSWVHYLDENSVISLCDAINKLNYLASSFENKADRMELSIHKGQSGDYSSYYDGIWLPCDNLDYMRVIYRNLSHVSPSRSGIPIVDNITSLFKKHYNDFNKAILTVRMFESTLLKQRVLNAILQNELELNKIIKSNRDFVRHITNLSQTLIILHPFEDGNGRTFRMMTNYLLMAYGMPPPTLEYNSPIFLSSDQYMIQVIDGIQLSYQLIFNNSNVTRPIHNLGKVPEVGVF